MYNFPAHYAALTESQRLPTLQARLAAMAADPAQSPRAALRFFAGAFDPDNPPASASALVYMPLSARAGVIVDEMIPDPEADPEDPDPPLVRSLYIDLDMPVEGTVTGADPATGSVPGFAVLYAPDGAPLYQFTAGLTGSGAEIALVQTGEEAGVPVVRWYQGAVGRVASFVVAG